MGIKKGVFIAFWVLFFLSTINFDINIYDEGVALVGALNVINGKKPYIDFWTMYSPGWFYLLAGWIMLFGKQILAIRILTLIINTFNLFLFFYILKKGIKASNVSFIILLCLIAFYSINPFYARNVPFSISIYLLSFFLLLSDMRWKYFLLGLCAGFFFLIRHDFAIYFALWVFSSLFVQFLLDKNKLRFINIIVFACVFFCFVSIFSLLLSSTGMLQGFIQDAILFPITHFGATRSLPFPNPFSFVFDLNLSIVSKFYKLWETTIFYLPWSLLILSCVLFFYKRKSSVKFEYYDLFAIGGVLFLSFQGVIRSDLEHIFPSLVFGLLLLGKFLERYLESKKIALVLILVFFVVPPFFKKVQSIFLLYNSRKSIELASINGNNIKIPSTNSYYNDLLNFISTSFGNKLFFSGLNRHDRIYTNDVILYYLVDKLPPTKYYELHPGLATNESIQKKIIDELIEKKIEWLVIYDNQVYENQNYIGSDTLDKFFSTNYKIFKKFGRYSIYKIRS
ncbi:MAG: hypothetical protein N2560_10495 [Ignavibacteria bacterium]|nr:hypothetical protein [Ignavibacteria bacterium]